MKTLIMVMMIAGLMSTVGVYAAGLGGAPSIKTVGGTGSVSVSAPTSAAVTMDWTQNSVGLVSAVKVKWTPDTATTYDITFTGASVATTITTPTTATIERTDTINITPVAANLLTTAEVVIKEN